MSPTDRTLLRLLVLASLPLLAGCAAFTNPVANGIPVRALPDELLAGPRRDDLETIPLTLLEQEPPEKYALAAGDVLGIFIDGVLPVTSPQQPPSNPPVYFPSQIDPLGKGLEPALGYPVPIRNDGTVSLPFVEPVQVDGMSVEEATEAIRTAYLEKEVLQAGRERIMVTLMQPRRVRVLVFRQEVGGFQTGGRGDITTSTVKRGTGHAVELRAYRNDVLNALVKTGGLPGLDAYESIAIFKRGQDDPQLTRKLQSLSQGESLCLDDLDVKAILIPTRWPPDEPLPFSEKDIKLETGDVVFLEARVLDLFYTGGLLPAGEYILPRDYDLDVVEAVTKVRGSLLNGAFGGSNLSGAILKPGFGNQSPSLLTVVRRTPDGGQIPIRVDLNRAMRDPRERILLQPGDILVLQETPGEAMARFVTDTFNLTFFTRAINRGSAIGTAGFSSTTFDATTLQGGR